MTFRTPAVPMVEPYASLAPVYDRLIGDARFEIIWRAFQRSCRQHDIGFQSLADIGCGTGRFLQRIGSDPRLTLYGVDRSAAMLAEARRRLAGKHVRLLRQDMKQLMLPAPVDLLTANFCTLNYLTEPPVLNKALRRFAINLCCNGHLIFDIILGETDFTAPASLRQLIEAPGLQAVWDIRPAPNFEGTIVSTSTCLQGPKGRSCSREQHLQRWWSGSAVMQALDRAGFRLLGLHRLADHAQPGPEDQWVQVVARRRD
jgi:SAM-dependent methyltransferase